MHHKTVQQEQTPTTVHNFARALKSALINSRHEWQYCFLERGGDSREIYLSAKQLLESSETVAKQLVRRTPPDSQVLLAMDHGPDFLICFLACIFARRTVIPAPLPRFESHSQRFANIAKLCDNAFILTKQHHFEPIGKVLQAEGLNFDSRILPLEDLRSELQDHTQVELPGFTASAKIPLVIQFTSGSTSTPKGVMISSENILANQRQVSTRWDFQKEKIVLNWLPYYHDMGLFGTLLYPLLGGLKVVQMDPLHFIQKPQRWLFAMSKFRANISGGPAFSYGLCNELELSGDKAEKIDLSNWQIAFCGADYVPSATMKQFCSNYLSYGFNPAAIMPVYGLAEATLFVAGQPNSARTLPLEYKENLTMGCYLGESEQPGVFIGDIKNSSALPSEEIGEVCFSGASVSQGYYQQGLTNSEQLLKSGDLGFIKDNYLFICGRLKDVIISHGQNISPATIEQIATDLSNQLNPHAAAAFQLYQPNEKIVLLIEVNKSAKGQVKNGNTLRSAIIALVQQRVGISLAEVAFLKRGELMRTSSGKVQRQVVAEKFHSGHIFKEAEDADC